MVLVVSRWFNEVGYSFKVSTKIDSLIRDQIRSKVLEPYDIDKSDEGFYLNLVVATSSNTTHLEVRGPEINKRKKMIDYGLWFPYKEIAMSDNPEKNYVENYIEALKFRRQVTCRVDFDYV
jgi:hypothetical protein